MNELPGCLGLEGGDVEGGSESGMLKFILHSQTLGVSEEGVTYSQVSAVIILFFSIQYLFCFA
jgi:hypothetical protein